MSMYFGNPNNNNNFFQNIGNAFKNAFLTPKQKDTFQQPSIPGYGFSPYQVNQGDTFETIAQNNNLSVPQIQAANGNMLIPPPKGSYINLPNVAPFIPPPKGSYINLPNVAPFIPHLRGNINLTNNTLTTPTSYGPPTPENYYQNQALNQFRQGEKQNFTPYGPPTPENYYQNQALNQFRQQEKDSINNTPLSTASLNTTTGMEKQAENYGITQDQINNAVFAGQLPQIVPINTPIVNPQTGQAVTPQEMVSNGYVFDTKSRSWRLSVPGGVDISTTETNTSGYNTSIASSLDAITSGINTDNKFQRVKASENYGAFRAQEAAFLSAKRWDPSRKKFVSIGQLIKEGRLDVRDRNARLKKARRGASRPKPQPQAANAGNSPAQNVNTNLGGG